MVATFVEEEHIHGHTSGSKKKTLIVVIVDCYVPAYSTVGEQLMCEDIVRC